MQTEERAAMRPKSRPKRVRPAGRPLTLDDPLFELLGSARSRGPGNVAENKRKYLTELHTTKE